MSNLSNITTIREIPDRHGFHFSKALGQNFLISLTVCPHVVEQSGAAPETGVLGVGPGTGVLTRKLAGRVQEVVSIELDRCLLPALEETLVDYDNITVVSGGILKLDLKELLQRELVGILMSACANLPYYITSPVTMRLLEEQLDITFLAVTVQKEAARRTCARPDTRECGMVTMAVHYYAEPEILFKASCGGFLPAPNVDSSVIRLTPHKESAIRVENEAGFFSLVRTMLGQRGETMFNPVSAELSLPKETVDKTLDDAGFDHCVRAERLTVQEFARLHVCLTSRKE